MPNDLAAMFCAHVGRQMNCGLIVKSAVELQRQFTGVGASVRDTENLLVCRQAFRKFGPFDSALGRVYHADTRWWLWQPRVDYLPDAVTSGKGVCKAGCVAVERTTLVPYHRVSWLIASTVGISSLTGSV